MWDSKNEQEFYERAKYLLFTARANTDLERGDRQWMSGITSWQFNIPGENFVRSKTEHEKSSLQQATENVTLFLNKAYSNPLTSEKPYGLSDQAWQFAQELGRGNMTIGEAISLNYKGTFLNEGQDVVLDGKLGKNSTAGIYRNFASYELMKRSYTNESILEGNPKTVWDVMVDNLSLIHI